MSIYGPSDCSEVAKTPGVTKNYVDMQDSLRILKTGDVMTRDLNLGGHLVRGLPTTGNEPYQADVAASWAQVVRLVADAVAVVINKNGDRMTGSLHMVGHSLTHSLTAYVLPAHISEAICWLQVQCLVGSQPRVKPVITNWAEKRGGLSAGGSEWSLGSNSARVSLVKDGVEQLGHHVNKTAELRSTVQAFHPPLELQVGTRLNFLTKSDTNNANITIVSLLIELNLG